MTSETFGSPQTPQPGSTTQTETTGTEHVWDGQGTSDDSGPSTTETAKEAAGSVAKEGVEGGKRVATVAADQAKEVASEAANQTKELLSQAKSELADQAAIQQRHVAEQLNALSRELDSMASKSEEQGPATDLAREASRRIGSAADWVADRDPGSLLTELKQYARQKPGTFLAIAAGIGLAAGRMTRGVTAGVPDDVSSRSEGLNATADPLAGRGASSAQPGAQSLAPGARASASGPQGEPDLSAPYRARDFESDRSGRFETDPATIVDPASTSNPSPERDDDDAMAQQPHPARTMGDAQ